MPLPDGITLKLTLISSKGRDLISSRPLIKKQDNWSQLLSNLFQLFFPPNIQKLNIPIKIKASKH